MAITGEVIQHRGKGSNLQAALTGVIAAATIGTVETSDPTIIPDTKVVNAVEIEDGVTMSAHFIVDDTTPSADEMLKALNDTIATAQRQRDTLVDIIARQKHMDTIDQARGRGKEITDLTETVLQGRKEIDNYKSSMTAERTWYSTPIETDNNLITIFEKSLAVKQTRLDTLNAAWEKAQTTVTQ